MISEALEQHENANSALPETLKNLPFKFGLDKNKFYEAMIIIDKLGNQATYTSNDAKHSSTSNIAQAQSTPKNIKISELFSALKSSFSSKVIFSKPALHNGDHIFFAGINHANIKTGEFDGAIIMVYNINQLTTYLKEFKIFDHSMIWLFTNNGDRLHKPKDDFFVDPLPYVFSDKKTESRLFIRSSEHDFSNSIRSILKIVISFPPKITSHLLKKSIIITSLILLSISVIVIFIFIAYLTAKRIIKPIQKLTEISQKVAAGDFNVKMPSPRNDEIGTLSQAFNIMIQELDEQRYELKSLANKDTLTQLPNRRKFEENLSQAVKTCSRTEQNIAIFYIDLDQFKDTNDSFGHPAGDKLIRDVSTRPSQTVRQTDLVARLGGDEFAIILNPHKTSADTERVAKKILVELNKPFMIEGHQIFSGGSIGISVYPEHGKDATELVKNADAAMYKAKSMGRNSYQFYSTNLTKKANERVVLGALIRNALQKDEFIIYYQPKVDLITKEVVGAEALLRWEHKNQLILPSKVIDIAEASGFIDTIDTWVLNTVCLQIKEWQKSQFATMPISINISGRLLEKNKVVAILKQALHKHSIDPKWIEIEITENHLISNHQQTQKTLKILHSLGLKVAIDDFGTGYSSLSYLKDLLADTLKIDRKFVVNAMTNNADKEIATAIVNLARSLNMQIVVEGIETEEQANFFSHLGVHSAQGYLYAKPMPTQEFVAFVNRTNGIKKSLRVIKK